MVFRVVFTVALATACVRVPSAQVCASVSHDLGRPADPTDWRGAPASATASACVDLEATR